MVFVARRGIAGAVRHLSAILSELYRRLLHEACTRQLEAWSLELEACKN